MQFQKEVYPCLQLLTQEVRNEEQTLELRIPEAMPDIGSILNTWGQVLLRSKEWKGNSMGITGGVMTWVLYAPEDGSVPRVVEGWVPFSINWDLPQSDRDGQILTSCLLRSIDSRCLSARKLMVRANISAMARGYLPSEFTLYTPGNLPQDVQLLQSSYPVCYPREAGEKPFQLDEDLMLPPEMTGAKLMSCSLESMITDQKLMADKLVFRGNAYFRALLRSPEGTFHSSSFEMPFSQYAQLDQEYPENTDAQLAPILTSLEPDILEDGRLRLKAGISCQYVICPHPLITVVEDAYSNFRDVQPNMDIAQIPMILQMDRRSMSVSQEMAASMDAVLDASMYLQQPAVQKGTEEAEITLSGSFSALGQKEGGALEGTSAKWEESIALPADRNARLLASCCPAAPAQAVLTSEAVAFASEVILDVTAMAEQGLPQLSGLELGELREPDPKRPALVLCRAGEKDLWSLAKESGSTMEAIRRTNKLSGDPAPGQMLLIPVL